MEKSLETSFSEAAEAIKCMKGTPTEDEMLELYAYYKQAQDGDCDKPKPGTFDLKGKYKWDAWNRMKGMDKDAAKRKYIELSKKILKKYGSNQGPHSQDTEL